MSLTLEHLKHPKTGKMVPVFVCEFKDGLGERLYITADGKLLDFCQPHFWEAIKKECEAKITTKVSQTFADLKAKRLAELASK